LIASARDLAEVTGDLSDAIEKMHRLVGEMREFVRADARPLEGVRLSDIVEEALALAPNPSKVSVEVSIASDERAVARRELLERVMDTLLSNAIGAAAHTQEPHVSVRVYRHAGESRISIRDSGPCIPIDLRDRIFEPFFHPRGAPRGDVGLAVCREFVSRMGGTLSLAPGNRGACFRIQLRPT
jgi:C4-dicarboxylate-specific signal transduction histidine kinase